MGYNRYYKEIINRLQGNTPGLEKLRDEDRLDFAGVNAVLELYESASMGEKVQFVTSMKQIVSSKSLDADVIAQTIDIAAGLEIPDLKDKVEELFRSGLANNEPIRTSVYRYLSFIHIWNRRLATVTVDMADEV